MSNTPMIPAEQTLPPVPNDPKAAAVLFSQVYKEMEAALKRGFNKLDAKSQANLDELYAYMRMNPARPATVINLHPWPMYLPQNRLTAGLVIAACPPGSRFAHTYIRGWRKDWEHDDDGQSLKFKAIRPIQLAGEFVHGFSNNDFSNKNGCNGGVIIYEGESHPDKTEMVECYDANGRLVTTDEIGTDYEGEQPVQVVHKVPVRRKLADIIAEAINGRNKFYFGRVQKADSDYRDEKKRGLMDLTLPRLMAEVLHAEGLLPVVPQWNLATRMQQGLADDNCPACSAPRKIEAIVCSECKHPLEVVECYDRGIITWEQLEMHTLSTEEYEQALEIKQTKEDRKAEAMKRVQERKEATAKPKVAAKGKEKAKDE